MPLYVCPKCGKRFKQKSHWDDHKAKKFDCGQSTMINEIIQLKVEEKVKEVVKATQQKPDITSENLASFFEDLHNLLWSRAGLPPQTALEHLTFFFAYRLIEQQADALNLPQECRWSYIANLKNENDLFETIKKGVASFRAKPKTKSFFKPHEIQKADVVFEIVQQINRISLNTLQETDTLGDIFEYMLGRGMSTMSDEGQYFTNRQICRLAFKLAHSIKKNLRRSDGSLCTFADWFCGTGGFTEAYVRGVNTNLRDVNWKKDGGAIYCQDMNTSSITTTLLNLLIHTGTAFSTEKIRSSNSFADPIIYGSGAPFKELTIDYCFMNPPYGGDKSKGKEYKFAYSKKIKADDGSSSKKYLVNEEIKSIGIEDDDKVSAGVQLGMATLSVDGGVCAIVLPQGFFFGATKKCVELRKKIVEEYKIHFVVDIASGSFLNTGTKTSMIVFQKGVGSTDKVSFIGMDENLLVEASLEDLRGKNYSLNYKQYLPQSVVEVDGFEMVKLGDILEFQKKPGKLGSADGKEIGKFPFYTCGQKKMYVDTCEFTKTCLIVNRGGMMNVRVDKNFSISHDDIHVLSWIDGKTCETTVLYVAYYLQANMKLLTDGMNGTTLKHLNKSYLDEIQIPIPSLETQQQIVEAIDGWAKLAQHEEAALKMLEKQVMFYVKEMGKGKELVKLGDVCEFKRGKMITKKDLIEGEFPVIGGGLSPMGYHNESNREAYTPLISQSGENAGHVSRYTNKVWASDCFSVTSTHMNNDLLYYSLLLIQADISFLKTGTGQPHIYPSSIESLVVPLPSLAEQQTLQADFDEIRHKYEKIAQYKSKAQEAINRLIPKSEE
jgi:restriction endonuclease S subunit/type I restriction-modification system DNA methylase subunit